MVLLLRGDYINSDLVTVYVTENFFTMFCWKNRVEMARNVKDHDLHKNISPFVYTNFASNMALTGDHYSRLTRGGRKNKGPAFSAGQWPSLACNAEKKWTALRSVAVVVS